MDLSSSLGYCTEAPADSRAACPGVFVWMHYRPQNGKAELSRLGIFSSFLCSLHFSSVCLCSSLKHCDKEPRHLAHGNHAIHWVLVVLGRAKLRQKLAFPWQQQLELWAQPALCCPSDMVESLGASCCGVFHPCTHCPAPLPGAWVRPGRYQAGPSGEKRMAGWQDLPSGFFSSFFPVSTMSHVGQQAQNWACHVQLWNLEPVLAGNRNWNRSLGKYSPLP